MEEAMLQQLLKAAVHAHFHHVVRVHTELANRIKVGELDAVDPLHRQHPAAGGVAINRRNSDARVVLMQLSEGLSVRGLVEVIHLFEHPSPQFIDQGDEVAADQSDVAVQPGGDVAHDVQIQGDLFAQPRALHLHRHPCATLEGSLVHLTQGGG